MRYLVTSALPYINGVKHLGNLVGSMLPADVYVRYLRARQRQVLFICATDEHGTPAELAALAAGVDVAQYCRRMHEVQDELCRRFSISFDHFGRSSSAYNHDLTRRFATALTENGYITSRPIRQVYSIDDGRFLPDRYVTGTCPYCGYRSARGDQCESCTRVLDPTDLINPRSTVSGSNRLEIRESLHLFLLLSELEGKLRSWIESRQGWPVLAMSIARKWLDEGLQDRCITRDLKWGVPVGQPGFEGKVFYVWFDAPIEYIGATWEWAELEPTKRDARSWWWNAQDVYYTQFMAKDNVPFHSIVFPATILGSRQPWKMVDFIKSFSWLTYEGGKFSTSARRGVFMNDALELLPADYWRYWLMANAPESTDADFTWESFGNTVNKDLVGVFGNFVNRILKFGGSRFGSAIPDAGSAGLLEERLYAELGQRVPALTQHMDDLSFRKAMQELRTIWTAGNTYLSEAEPWKMRPEEISRIALVVRVGINLIRLFAVLSEPIVPATCARIFDALGLSPEERRWPDRAIREELSVLAPGREVASLDLLFRRIEDQELEAWKQRFAGASAALRE